MDRRFTMIDTHGHKMRCISIVCLHHQVGMCFPLVMHHTFSAVIILQGVVILQTFNSISINMVDPTPPTWNKTVFLHTLCYTVQYQQQEITIATLTLFSHLNLISQVQHHRKCYIIRCLSLIRTSLSADVSSLATNGTCQRRIHYPMNLLHLQILSVLGRPDCRFGNLGSFVSPSYSVVSKHTGKIFFLKVLCTSLNV